MKQIDALLTTPISWGQGRYPRNEGDGWRDRRPLPASSGWPSGMILRIGSASIAATTLSRFAKPGRRTGATAD